MRENCDPSAFVTRATRRQIIAAAAASLGALALAPVVSSQSQSQPAPGMKQSPSPSANASRTSLHQEISYKVAPQRVYEVLLDSKQFAAFTGMPADIDPSAGGALKMFGGLIEGRNVELIPNQRIVQAWRPSHWDPGVYSIAKFQLNAQGSGVLVVLDHTGFPEGDYDHLYSGWTGHYWDPLTKYFA